MHYIDTQENVYNKSVCQLYKSFYWMHLNILVPTSCRMFLIELCFQSCSERILGMTQDSKAWVTLGHFIGVNQWIPLNLPSTSRLHFGQLWNQASQYRWNENFPKNCCLCLCAFKSENVFSWWSNFLWFHSFH